MSSATILAFPYLAGKLLDIASGKEIPYFDSINEITVALLAILFVQAIFSFTRVYTFSVVSERSLADLRSTVFMNIIWLPLTFFDNRRTGELMSRITSDVSTLTDMFSFTLAELLRQFLTLVLGTFVIFFLAPKLTGFMLLTFPVLVLLALFFGKYIRKLSKQTQDRLAEANVVVEESLQSVSIVKAFTNEAFEINRYSKALKDAVSVAIHTARFRGLFISFVIFALFGGIVAVGWYGATLVQSNVITVGNVFIRHIYFFIGGSIAGSGTFTLRCNVHGASERLLQIWMNQTNRIGVHDFNCKARSNLSVSFSTLTKSFEVLKN